VQFDIRYDPTSDITLAEFNDLSTWPTTLTNSAGQTVMQSWAGAGYLAGSTPGLDVMLCGGPGGQEGTTLTNFNIPAAAASGWVHVTIPINPAWANLDGANGIVFHKWINQQWGIAAWATARVWIDNLMVQGTAAPPPPPTLSLSPAYAGLNLFGASGGNNDRENIRTVDSNFSWVGQGSTPVSYSFTITNFPSAANPLFMINTFLIPVPYDHTAGTNGTVGGESAPDWNEASCIFLDFENYSDGSGDWRFRYKTNAPGSNGSYYSDVLADLRDYAGVLGTWTVTFNNNTNVTMTSPHNVTTNFVFSPDKVYWWSDNSGNALPMYYYLGCRWNGSSQGLGAVVSDTSIQGAPETLNDNFMADTSLDSTMWQVLAAYAPSIQLVPSSPAPVYWVTWTLPATGFSLQSAPALNGTWSPAGQTPLLFAGEDKSLITTTGLPSASQGYFQLVNRVFSQLQVLLPGETNAPGTRTGKTGSPMAYSLSAGQPLNVTINACDQSWNIITAASDEVQITSTDPNSSAIPGAPQISSLTAGTTQIQFSFGSEGTFTITASDDTDTNILSNTSSPIVSGP
jgi:hypothetical protein